VLLLRFSTNKSVIAGCILLKLSFFVILNVFFLPFSINTKVASLPSESINLTSAFLPSSNSVT